MLGGPRNRRTRSVDARKIFATELQQREISYLEQRHTFRSIGCMAPATILVVDDESSACAVLRTVLTAAGHQVEIASDGLGALAQIERGTPDLILSDLHMPNMGGLELLRELKRRNLPVPLILMTASNAVDSAVRAMREGAVDYLIKPLNLDELSIVIDRTLESVCLRQEAASLKSQIEELARFDNIVGHSPEIRDVFRRITQIAPSRATVLLTGETGTGKELVAAAIHHRSPRAAGPFVRVHCGALADGMLESELFGHERGSFTGAAEQRQGRFEQANGGTLLLDEIGEISLGTQIKLLRVLQEREFERVGGQRDRSRRRANRHGHQPRSQADGDGRRLPRRFVLSPERHQLASSAAARASLGHSAAGQPLFGKVRDR